jgi:hypothetical protein
MRSRIVTPQEMHSLFGADVQDFAYSFAITRRQKSQLEIGVVPTLQRLTSLDLLALSMDRLSLPRTEP